MNSMKCMINKVTFNNLKYFFPCNREFSTESLRKTRFYDLHLKLGGKMVPFAGYSMPVQYEGLGVLKEHVHTRTKGCASLFDVSHMGQIKYILNYYLF